MIQEQREKEYGSPDESFDRIAYLWSGYLAVSVSGKDVAYMMAMLKMSREKHESKFDNRLDAASYCVLADKVNNE